MRREKTPLVSSPQGIVHFEAMTIFCKGNTPQYTHTHKKTSSQKRHFSSSFGMSLRDKSWFGVLIEFSNIKKRIGISTTFLVSTYTGACGVCRCHWAVALRWQAPRGVLLFLRWHHVISFVVQKCIICGFVPVEKNPKILTLDTPEVQSTFYQSHWFIRPGGAISGADETCLTISGWDKSKKMGHHWRGMSQESAPRPLTGGGLMGPPETELVFQKLNSRFPEDRVHFSSFVGQAFLQTRTLGHFQFRVYIPVFIFCVQVWTGEWLLQPVWPRMWRVWLETSPRCGSKCRPMPGEWSSDLPGAPPPSWFWGKKESICHTGDSFDSIPCPWWHHLQSPEDNQSRKNCYRKDILRLNEKLLRWTKASDLTFC